MGEESDSDSANSDHIGKGSRGGTFGLSLKELFNKIREELLLRGYSEEEVEKELEKLAGMSMGAEFAVLNDVPIVKEIFERGPGRKILSERDSMKLHDSDVDLNIFYRFAHFVQKHGLNRGFLHFPFLPFKIISCMLTYRQYKKYRRRLHQTWDLLYPSSIMSPRMKDRVSRRLMSYIVEIFWEIVFYAFNHRVHNYRKYIKMQSLKPLQEALKEGRGVLVPTLHLGEMFHSLSGVIRNAYIDKSGKRRQIKLSILSSPENEFLFRELVRIYRSMKPIVTGKFKDLHDDVAEVLRENRAVFLMQDYCNYKQLRVPFIYGINRYEFLIPTPGLLSYFHLHEDFRSPIVPIIVVPQDNKDIRYSRLLVFDPIDFRTMDPDKEEDPILSEEIRRFQRGELNKKQQRGLISLYINRLLYPFILRYPYLWEESIPFMKRTNFTVDYTGVVNYPEFFKRTLIRFKELIENSYEPGREDEKIIHTIETCIEESDSINVKFLNGDFKEFRKVEREKTFPEKFELGRYRGKDALKRIVKLLTEKLPNELEAEYIPYIHMLEKMVSYWPIRAEIPTYRIDKLVNDRLF